MPVPGGTEPIIGPLIDVSGALLAPTLALHNSGAISLRGGQLERVNAAGDAWIPVVVPGGFLYGAGVPAAALGDDGNSYLDTTAGTFYVKASGAWTCCSTPTGRQRAGRSQPSLT